MKTFAIILAILITSCSNAQSLNAQLDTVYVEDKKAWDFFTHFEVIINERRRQNMEVLMENDPKHRNAFYVIDQMINDNVNPESIVKRILGLGSLKTVLRIADEYISDNVDIMEIHSATGSYAYTSSGNAKFGDIPLKVLIDSSTSGYGLLLAGLLTIYEKAELIVSPTSKDGKLQMISFLMGMG